MIAKIFHVSETPRGWALSRLRNIPTINVQRGSAGFDRAVLEYIDEPGQLQPAALTMKPLAPEYPEGQAL